jgi:NADPH2:quinone reductase
MSNSQTMKAISFYYNFPLSHPESFIDLEIEKPVPTGRDLRVEVSV